MSQRSVLRAAVASAISLGLLPVISQAHDMADHRAPSGKEKCYGVAKAGENSCANLSATHDCAGEASEDKSPVEFKLVPKGTCAKLGGMNTEQAKAALAKATSKP
ncbi:MAG: hypothetical protein RI907_2896 [Pseudomonadota bacterium]|jgi:uncharacterized membrane protein